MGTVCTKEIPLSKHIVRVLKLLRQTSGWLDFILFHFDFRLYHQLFPTSPPSLRVCLFVMRFSWNETSVTSLNEPLMCKLYFGFCFEYYKRVAQTAVVINAPFAFAFFFFFIQWNWSPVKLPFTFVESAERILQLGVALSYTIFSMLPDIIGTPRRVPYWRSHRYSQLPSWLIDHSLVTRATRSLRSWDIHPISARPKSMPSLTPNTVNFLHYYPRYRLISPS